MSLLSKKLRSTDYGNGRLGVSYWCQGCKRMHGIITDGPGAWGWDRNVDSPTFTPSVLTTYRSGEPPVTPENFAEYKLNPWPQTKKDNVCHTFITNGMVQFLGDCTHEFVNQTVPLPDLPDYHQD